MNKLNLFSHYITNIKRKQKKKKFIFKINTLQTIPESIMIGDMIELSMILDTEGMIITGELKVKSIKRNGVITTLILKSKKNPVFTAE